MPLTPYRTLATPGLGLPGPTNLRKGLRSSLAGWTLHGKLAVKLTELLMRCP